MNFKNAVMFVLTGITLGAIGLFLSAFIGGNSAGTVVFLILLGLAVLLMLIGVIGGWIGFAKEKVGYRIEERRIEKYYKTHPEQK